MSKLPLVAIAVLALSIFFQSVLFTPSQQVAKKHSITLYGPCSTTTYMTDDYRIYGTDNGLVTFKNGEETIKFHGNFFIKSN